METKSLLRKIRWSGVVTLALFFLVSAGVTIAYFSPEATSSQTAAVVVAQESATTTNPFVGIDLQAQSAYVIDLATGEVLFSQNADAQLPLASLTKVAMALAVSDVLPPDSLITIPTYTLPPDGTERLPAGGVWTVRDVLSFTLAASSDQDADILAQAADGDIRAKYPDAPQEGAPGSATIWRMNALAQELGLTETYFLNDNGLDLSTTQSGAYGSARDMAKLFAYAASTSPSLFAATTRDSVTITGANGEKATATNTDTALSTIPGVIMGKTGYTDLAGGNLAIVFDVGPVHPVVAVVLHSTQQGRFDDMQKLVAAVQESVAEGR